MEIQKKAWAQFCISERVIKVQNYCFSMNTSFFWKQNEDESYTLLSEQHMPQSYYVMQLWKIGREFFFRTRPLPGTKVVDLIGQRRAIYPFRIYFATDETILVILANERPLVFSSDAKIVDIKKFDMS